MADMQVPPVPPTPDDRRRRVPLWVFALTGGLAFVVALSLVGAAFFLRDMDSKKADPGRRRRACAFRQRVDQATIASSSAEGFAGPQHT
jgi:hypothetical protein